MTKSLVTGGNGYLGKELVKQLACIGQNILSVDLEIPQEQIDGVEYLAVDLLDTEQISCVFTNHHFNRVYHFAGVSSLNEASNDFTRTIITNSLVTLKLLNQMHNSGVGRLIYASSMYVFSDKGGTYRLSKQISEQLIEEFCKNYPVNASIIRFGSIYGPGSNDANGLHEIIKGALTEDSIKYQGDSESMREYIHICDAIRACVEISGLEVNGSKSYLVTGDKLFRVNDVLLMIKEMLNSQKPIEFENRQDAGHYITTPYTYSPSAARKYQLSETLDFSHGLWELINYVANVENVKRSEGRQ